VSKISGYLEENNIRSLYLTGGTRLTKSSGSLSDILLFTSRGVCLVEEDVQNLLQSGKVVKTSQPVHKLVVPGGKGPVANLKTILFHFKIKVSEYRLKTRCVL